MASSAETWGVSNVPFSSADLSGADAAVTDAPVSTKRLVIREYIISVDTSMRVDLKEETSGTVMFSHYVLANTSIHIKPRSKRRLPTADKKLVGRSSASGNVRILVSYASE